MPDDVATRTTNLLCGVIDLMRDPTPELPVRPLLELLRLTFECTAVTWAWTEADDAAGMIMDASEATRGDRESLELSVSGEARRQLSIVYRREGSARYAFVVVRTTPEFDADDLAVADVVQRAVRSLDQQCAALARLLGTDGSPADGADRGLSGRELAVLQLVANGDTTRVIARRLGCTPRTVEKHLERCYRKLGVRDRLNAVRVARLIGVLDGASTPRQVDAGRLNPG